MKSINSIGITGLGYAVGSGVRGNKDPIFKWLDNHNVANKDLFAGYKDRAVLQDGESLESMMVSAATAALANANVNADEIDTLTGYASISKYLVPNGLAAVHQQLGMSDNCWVLPVQAEYTNYLAGIRIANAMIASGSAKKVLVVCGCNWTQHVDYHQAASLSVGDGACAAVISETRDTGKFSLLDSATLCATKWYGAMDMSPRELLPAQANVRLGAYTKALFNLDAKRGGEAFNEFGKNAPPELALKLIKDNGLTPSEVTVISHQASSVLLNYWKDKINPKQYLDTMAKFGNLTLASMGVTLAYKYDQIETEYLVLLGIGIQQETSALLFKRNH